MVLYDTLIIVIRIVIKVTVYYLLQAGECGKVDGPNLKFFYSSANIIFVQYEMFYSILIRYFTLNRHYYPSFALRLKTKIALILALSLLAYCDSLIYGMNDMKPTVP